MNQRHMNDKLRSEIIVLKQTAAQQRLHPTHATPSKLYDLHSTTTKKRSRFTSSGKLNSSFGSTSSTATLVRDRASMEGCDDYDRLTMSMQNELFDGDFNQIPDEAEECEGGDPLNKTIEKKRSNTLLKARGHDSIDTALASTYIDPTTPSFDDSFDDDDDDDCYEKDSDPLNKTLEKIRGKKICDSNDQILPSTSASTIIANNDSSDNDNDQLNNNYNDSDDDSDVDPLNKTLEKKRDNYSVTNILDTAETNNTIENTSTSCIGASTSVSTNESTSTITTTSTARHIVVQQQQSAELDDQTLLLQLQLQSSEK